MNQTLDSTLQSCPFPLPSLIFASPCPHGQDRRSMSTAQINSVWGVLCKILTGWKFFIFFFQHLTTNPAVIVRALVFTEGSSSLLLWVAYFHVLPLLTYQPPVGGNVSLLPQRRWQTWQACCGGRQAHCTQIFATSRLESMWKQCRRGYSAEQAASQARRT